MNIELLLLTKVRLAVALRSNCEEAKAQKARAEVVRLKRQIELSPLADAQIEYHLALLAATRDQRVQAFRGLERAIEFYDAFDLHDKGEALMVKAELQRHHGASPDVYIASLLEGASLLDRRRKPVAGDIASINQITYHVIAGRHAEAETECQSVAWDPEPPVKIQAYKLAMEGCLALAGRDCNEATGRLNEAVSVFYNLGAKVDIACCNLCLAELGSLAGEMVEVRHYGREAIRLFRECGHRGPAKRAKWAVQKLARGEWDSPLACLTTVKLTAGPIANIGG